MKVYNIFDAENEIEIGTLIYYEKEKSFVIELCDNLDEWTAPILLTAFVKKKIYTIPKDISFDWVKERVIPSGRQNISDILKNSRLKEYDEMRLLELSEGKCSQDSMFIRKISELPDYVIERQKFNLDDVCLLDEERLLCIFKNEEVRLIELSKLKNEVSKDIVRKVKRHRVLYESGKVGTGGYSLTFNENLDIPATELYSIGAAIPMSKADIITYVRKNIFDTVESCRELECTRQNLAYMNGKGQLIAIKENVKGNLYIKGDVLKNKWD